PRFAAPSLLASVGRSGTARIEAAVLRVELCKLDNSGENADFVLDALSERFTSADHEEQLARLEAHGATRKHGPETAGLMRELAGRTYGTRFEPGSPLSEQVLWPSMAAECHGM